jgi:hypothetical protein
MNEGLMDMDWSNASGGDTLDDQSRTRRTTNFDLVSSLLPGS